jgi:hypothetical protein
MDVTVPITLKWFMRLEVVIKHGNNFMKNGTYLVKKIQYDLLHQVSTILHKIVAMFYDHF